MLSRKSVAALLLGGSLACGICSTASAQDSNEVYSRAAAASEMTKKDLSEALQQYLELRIDYAGAEIDYSIGRTYQRLFQCKNAKQFYEAVMVNYTLKADHPIFQKTVENYDAIATCDDWQKVNLSCTIPEGGSVMIDNEHIGQCWDRPYALPDGEHTFKLIAADGKEVVETITTQSGQPAKSIKLSFPPERVEIEKVVEKVENYEYKERFHPALYWGLISGGVALIAGGAGFSAMANNALVDVQKYEDEYAVVQSDEAKQKAKKNADDARSKVDTANALMYSFIGVGAATAVTGVALAIVSAVSPKEKIVIDDLNAFVTPHDGGMMAGFGLSF